MAQVNYFLLFIDLIWLCSVGASWSSSVPASLDANDWNSQIGIHVFAIIMSVVNMLLKVRFKTRPPSSSAPPKSRNVDFRFSIYILAAEAQNLLGKKTDAYQFAGK